MASKVRVGQVWREGDKRFATRTVTIRRLLGNYAEVLSDAGYTSRIRLDRFDGKQYVLVPPDA